MRAANGHRSDLRWKIVWTASVAFVRTCAASCIASAASSTVAIALSGSFTVPVASACEAPVAFDCVFSSEEMASVSALPKPDPLPSDPEGWPAWPPPSIGVIASGPPCLQRHRLPRRRGSPGRSLRGLRSPPPTRFACSRRLLSAEAFDLPEREAADRADRHDHLSSPSVALNIDFAVCIAVTSDW